MKRLEQVLNFVATNKALISEELSLKDNLETLTKYVDMLTQRHSDIKTVFLKHGEDLHMACPECDSDVLMEYGNCPYCNEELYSSEDEEAVAEPVKEVKEEKKAKTTKKDVEVVAEVKKEKKTTKQVLETFQNTEEEIEELFDAVEVDDDTEDELEVKSPPKEEKKATKKTEKFKKEEPAKPVKEDKKKFKKAEPELELEIDLDEDDDIVETRKNTLKQHKEAAKATVVEEEDEDTDYYPTEEAVNKMTRDELLALVKKSKLKTNPPIDKIKDLKTLKAAINTAIDLLVNAALEEDEEEELIPEKKAPAKPVKEVKKETKKPVIDLDDALDDLDDLDADEDFTLDDDDDLSIEDDE